MWNNEWRDVVGYDGLYRVNRDSTVCSVRREIKYERNGLTFSKFVQGRKLKQQEKNNGYLQVALYRNGHRIQHLVHRVVAEAFLPNPDYLPEVHHKDHNQKNNHVDNLEWRSKKKNIQYRTEKAKQEQDDEDVGF